MRDTLYVHFIIVRFMELNPFSWSIFIAKSPHLHKISFYIPLYQNLRVVLLKDRWNFKMLLQNATSNGFFKIFWMTVLISLQLSKNFISLLRQIRIYRSVSLNSASDSLSQGALSTYGITLLTLD